MFRIWYIQITQCFFLKSFIEKYQVKCKYSLYDPVILWIITILIMLTIQLYIYNVLFTVNINGEIHKW